MADLEERLREARLWAAENGCILTLSGEIGFGRECVGVTNGNSYVDTPGSGYCDQEGHSKEYLDKVSPPDSVTPYHKHDCLCVLGRDLGALIQLLDWIDKLRSFGATVRVEDRRFESRQDHPIARMLHGSTRSVISFPDLPDDDKTVYYWEAHTSGS